MTRKNFNGAKKNFMPRKNFHDASRFVMAPARRAPRRKFWNLSPSVASKRHNAFHQEAKSGKQCFRCLHSVRDRAGTAPGPRRERRGERKRKEERREEKRREEERRGANPPKPPYRRLANLIGTQQIIMSLCHGLI